MHATTRRVVAEQFAEEQPSLRPLPAGPFQATLRLERRITRDGMVSVEGNLSSVPDSTRRRAVEVHLLAEELRIFEENRLVASHPVLEGSAGSPAVIATQGRPRAAWGRAATTSSPFARARRSRAGRWR